MLTSPYSAVAFAIPDGYGYGGGSSSSTSSATTPGSPVGTTAGTCPSAGTSTVYSTAYSTIYSTKEEVSTVAGPTVTVTSVQEQASTVTVTSYQEEATTVAGPTGMLPLSPRFDILFRQHEPTSFRNTNFNAFSQSPLPPRKKKSAQSRVPLSPPLLLAERSP